MKRLLLATIVATFAAVTADAQSSDVGTLWRGPTPVAARTTDSSTAKRTADSLKVVKRVQDSLAARTAQLDKLTRSLQDSIARLSAKLTTRPETAVVKAAPAVVPVPAKEIIVPVKEVVVPVKEVVAPAKEAISPAKEVVVPAKETAPVTGIVPAKEAVTAKVVAPAKEAAPLVPSAAALSAKLDSLKAAQVAAEKALTQKLSGLGNFRFSGDVRVRYEGQFQAGGFVTRHRERSRARIGVTGNIADDLVGGVAIASGALDDVQSANQTQTGFFSRKAIGFDRFYLNWKPMAGHGFTMSAGKFAYPWERTSLTFGNDINPEGVSAAWALAHKGVFQGATIVGFALPFLEIAGDNDSYVAGGQVQTRWKLGTKANARVSAASLSFHGVDAIAQAAATGTIKPASANTNRVRTDSTGKVLGYASSYSYQDIVAVFDYTARPRLPVALQVNVVRNSDAQSGEGTGAYSDLRVGRLSQAHDIQAAWTMFRIERDAVIGAFNEQDLRAATNVLNHRVTLAYQWRANATVSAGLWLGRMMEPEATGKLAAPNFKTACTTSPFTDCRDPWLKRLQLDLSYKF